MGNVCSKSNAICGFCGKGLAIWQHPNTEWPDATWHNLVLRSVSSAPSSLSRPMDKKGHTWEIVGNSYPLDPLGTRWYKYLCSKGFDKTEGSAWSGFAVHVDITLTQPPHPYKSIYVVHIHHVHALLFGGFSTGHILQTEVLNL